MRTRNEYQQLTESYKKVLSEGPGQLPGLADAFKASQEAPGPVVDFSRTDADIDLEDEAAGEEGEADKKINHAAEAYGKMVALLDALEALKKEYATKIEPNDDFFAMINQITGIAGTEGEEEDDDHREEEDDNIDMEIDPNEKLMGPSAYL